jgi:hypothetical protein
MIKTMPNAGGRRRVRRSHHPVKLTALLYLKEALIREQYEKCADAISVAKEFGALPFEVQDLLEDPRRSPS